MKPARLTVFALLVATVPVLAQENPTPTPTAIEEALAAFAAGDSAGAIALLEDTVETADDQTRALLGALYVETGRAAEAMATLEPLAAGDTADPAVLYNAGRAALMQNRREVAREYLERSVRALSGSPAVRELGLLNARERRYVEGYALLKPWAAANPEDTEARLLAALCAVQLRRPNEAEELLSDLPQDDPRVKLLWGQLLNLKADPWGALAILKPLLESPAPGMEQDVRRLVAESYAAVGEAAKAVEVLTGHVDGNPVIALQLGQAQYQSGDLEGALATLEPFAEGLLAVAQAPAGLSPGPSLSLIVEYGRLLATGGRHADALPYLETATRLDPDNKQSWQQLGQALAAVGRRDEAKTALERFQQIVSQEVPASLRDVQLEKDFEDPTGRELREAMKELEKGDREKALAIARREMAIAPDDIRPHLVEANILLMSGDPGAALEAANRLVESAGWSADAYYLRGTARMATGELEPGEADLRKAIELSPEHTAAMNDLAMLLASRGSEESRQEARALLERALELRPGDELARANLERLGG